jgi:hypothetical protein
LGSSGCGLSIDLNTYERTLTPVRNGCHITPKIEIKTSVSSQTTLWLYYSSCIQTIGSYKYNLDWMHNTNAVRVRHHATRSGFATTRRGRGSPPRDAVGVRHHYKAVGVRHSKSVGLPTLV